MAGQVLSAEVNIETGGAVSRLSVLEARLKKLQNVAADAATGPAKFAKALELIKKTGSEISGLQKLQTQLGQGIPRSSGQATLALTNFNRVVQDAPFGIIGIANNIDPLITSFRSLKASTGSTGAAIKALFSTLAGPTGILFAFSALSTGATLLVQKYGSLGNAFDVLTGKTKALSEEQKKYVEDQKNLAISIEKQKIETEQLVKIARGDIGSKGEQAAAIAKLNDIIPDYIGVLTEQNIKTAEGIKIINEYTNALIKQATAELLTNRAAELAVKKFDAQETLIKGRIRNLKEQADVEARIAAERKKENKNLIGSGLDLQASTFDALGSRLIKLREQYKENEQAFITSVAEINKEIERLKKGIDDNTVILDTSDDAKNKVKKKLKKFYVKAISEFISEFNINEIPLPKQGSVTIDVPFQFSVGDKSQDPYQVAEQAIKGFVDQLEYQAKSVDVKFNGILSKPIQKELTKIRGIISSFESQGLTVDSFVVAEAVTKAQERLAAISAAFIQLQMNIRSILSGFTQDMFAGIGEVIGAGLADGAEGIKRAAAGIGSLIGNLFVNLGKEMIKASSLMIALQAALKSLQGPASLAAGIGLVALGSALKAKLGNIGATAFANGGIVTGPTLGLVGEAGQPEVILPLSKINQFMEQGQGGGALTLSVSGDVFQFALARNARKQSRLY